MNFQKITGLILLATGVAIILGTIIYSYRIFTNKVSVPAIFSEPQIVKTAAGGNQGQSQEVQIQEMLSQQMEKLIPQGSMIKSLNLAIWSLGAFVLFSGGSHLGTLGIKLLNK